jgi:division protein CdvB (Snf7/Vps24/ESCRT-III family)
MKKSTLINKFEDKLDLTLDALYDARDVISSADDYELDELVNTIVEELEVEIADASEKIREAVDNALD